MTHLQFLLFLPRFGLVVLILQASNPIPKFLGQKHPHLLQEYRFVRLGVPSLLLEIVQASSWGFLQEDEPSSDRRQDPHVLDILAANAGLPHCILDKHNPEVLLLLHAHHVLCPYHEALLAVPPSATFVQYLLADSEALGFRSLRLFLLQVSQNKYLPQTRYCLNSELPQWLALLASFLWWLLAVEVFLQIPS